jgi:hypothetical protein
MNVTRRGFLEKSVAGVAAAAVVGGAMAAETPAAAAAAPMVAACGIACSACPLHKAGKCGGCGPAHAVAAETVTKKGCPVLTCASMKKIAFCGTDCPMYVKCGKLIGRPYAKEFMERIAAKQA